MAAAGPRAAGDSVEAVGSPAGREAVSDRGCGASDETYMEVESITGSESVAAAASVDPDLRLAVLPHQASPVSVPPRSPPQACSPGGAGSSSGSGGGAGGGGQWASPRSCEACSGRPCSACGPAAVGGGGGRGGVREPAEGNWAWVAEPPGPCPRPQQIGRAALSRAPTADALPPPLPRGAFNGDASEVISLPDLRSASYARRAPAKDVAAELRESAARLLRRSVTARQASHLSAGQTFLCGVCFENHREDARLCLAGCPQASHGCCKPCAATFFRSRILQGRVFELPCPVGAAEGGCRASSSASSGREVAMASSEEVAACLGTDAGTLERYRRFLKVKVDPSLRECPDCQHFCSPHMNAETGRPDPAMKCGGCGGAFCYYHAAAHREGSCEEYEMRLAAETKTICESFGTKDCPRCSRQTMKGGGCNHMTCQVCRCEWCWICGAQLTVRGPHGEGPVYWHYSEENVDSGCQQFAEAGAHPDTEEVRLRRRERTPGPLVKRLSIPVGALAVVLLTTAMVLALCLWFVLYSLSCCLAAFLRFLARGAYHARRVDPPDALGEAGAQRLVKGTLYCAVTLGMVSFLIPFCALTITWDIVAVILCAILCVLGRMPLLRRCLPAPTTHHLRFLCWAPLRAVHCFGSSLLAHLSDGRGGHAARVVGADLDDP